LTLWNEFLTTNGYTAANPPPQTIAAQTQFVQFAQGVYSIENLSQALSPDEVRKRDIMFKTFDTLIAMLGTIQNSVAVQSQDLIYLGNLQQQLTSQLSAVPTYTGNASNSQSAPSSVTSSNLSQLTFGYSNLSAQEIAQWWAYQTAIGNTGASFTLSTAALVPGLSNNQKIPFLQVTIVAGSGLNIVGSTPNGSGGVNTLAIGAGPFPTVDTNPNDSVLTKYQSDLSSFETYFANAWNSTIAPAQTGLVNTYTAPGAQGINTSTQTNISATASDMQLTVPWPNNVTYVTPAGDTNSNDQSAGDAASKARAEYNSRDQQYIQNITSVRDTVQNTAQQVQQNLTNTNTSIQEESNLLSSIMSNLNDLITAIFK
ncbi:MAG: hypothetical protein JSR46_02910, partial [Verrucomicrobia bacterium]|nr:hypothetical protein [Verrucomicrobiota bacterium]